MGHSVSDCAALLDAMVGADSADSATLGGALLILAFLGFGSLYECPETHSTLRKTAGDLRDTVVPTSRGGTTPTPPQRVNCLDAARAGLKEGSLRNRRIGVVPGSLMGVSSPAAELASKRAVEALRAAGAVVVEIPRLAQPASVEVANARRTAEQEGHQKLISEGEFALLLAEFAQDLEAYFATRSGPGPKTLSDLIDFNETFKGKEMAHFGQEIFYMTRKAREEVAQADAQESAKLTQQLAVSTLHRCAVPTLLPHSIG